MKLYPHNKQAFEQAEVNLKDSNRTCIIHPTGTGKSLIIAEFINRYPGKKHLLLAPSRLIKDEISKYTKQRFTFATYQGLTVASDGQLPVYVDYDFIFLDEFHRIGAEIWGSRVGNLLKLNPFAKIVGTSATPIRYLDDHRNMATELFEDNISSLITLNAAIARGVLNPPIYVSALYSIKDEYNKLLQKIINSDIEDKEVITDNLNKSIIDWEKSGGIDTILKKHLTVFRNRIIVFCKDRKHMAEAKKVLLPSLKEIWSDLQAIEVYSEFTKDHNALALAQFSSQYGPAKVLFTIDMLNEGLHVKGANTVILMRDTISPIIFYQQIGRCFSVNQDQDPLIFDLVNNFASIRVDEFRNEFEEEQAGIEESEGKRFHPVVEAKVSVRFIDETKDVQEIFKGFSDSIERWEVYYQLAKKYYEANGNLIVPVGHELHSWLERQRAVFKRGELRKERELKLESIGMKWRIIDINFGVMIEELDAFYLSNGRIPTGSENKAVANFIQNQKTKIKKGLLSKDKVVILSKYKFNDEGFTVKWDHMFNFVHDFYTRNGHLELPQSNMEAIQWIARQKKSLSSANEMKKDKLALIGIVQTKILTKKPMEVWENFYARAVIFFKENGNLNFPPSEIDIIHWIKVQRKRVVVASEQKKEKLSQIGIKRKRPKRLA